MILLRPALVSESCVRLSLDLGTSSNDALDSESNPECTFAIAELRRSRVAIAQIKINVDPNLLSREGLFRLRSVGSIRVIDRETRDSNTRLNQRG